MIQFDFFSGKLEQKRDDLGLFRIAAGYCPPHGSRGGTNFTALQNRGGICLARSVVFCVDDFRDSVPDISADKKYF